MRGGQIKKYTRTTLQIILDFLLETVQYRRQWNIIFKMPKQKTVNPDSISNEDIKKLESNKDTISK